MKRINSYGIYCMKVHFWETNTQKKKKTLLNEKKNHSISKESFQKLCEQILFNVPFENDQNNFLKLL